MNDESVAAICLTHIGKRLNHEDNYYFDKQYLPIEIQKNMVNIKLIYNSSENNAPIRYFAVSDGMGGHNAGEVASYICVKKLAERESQIQKCLSLQEVVTILQAAILEINTAVCEMGCKRSELKGMGATLVICVIFGNDCAILNVGDSRAYHTDGNRIVQITKDNTEGQRMLDLGLLTRKELLRFPARKNLSRYIGYSPKDFILRADEYYPEIDGGTILLCSDGITDSLSDDQIADILRSESELLKSGRQLVERAVAEENADNATVILIPMGR